MPPAPPPPSHAARRTCCTHYIISVTILFFALLAFAIGSQCPDRVIEMQLEYEYSHGGDFTCSSCILPNASGVAAIGANASSIGGDDLVFVYDGPSNRSALVLILSGADLPVLFLPPFEPAAPVPLLSGAALVEFSACAGAASAVSAALSLDPTGTGAATVFSGIPTAPAAELFTVRVTPFALAAASAAPAQDTLTAFACAANGAFRASFAPDAAECTASFAPFVHPSAEAASPCACQTLGETSLLGASDITVDPALAAQCNGYSLFRVILASTADDGAWVVRAASQMFEFDHDTSGSQMTQIIVMACLIAFSGLIAFAVWSANAIRRARF
eukprot:gnl/Chilomastix_cuspidata/4509.p1 GENE.gnl/Chilomastix_cuspidata/4509~~gnl/Chilomastix_cuspidata/4509.p1  ORF type:complete len:331 (-),score=77.50 gnl/Chilomastix_cuspidata/4509:797-1789(-)